MGKILTDLVRYARRSASLGCMTAFLVAWLAYAWILHVGAGAWGDETAGTTLDWVVTGVLVALVQVFVVRYFGREVVALGRPRLLIWLASMVVLALGVGPLAVALQVVAYLTIEDLLAGWPWHGAAIGLIAATALFPVAVWQISLLAGAPRVGFWRSWTGVWRHRPLVLASALALYAFGYAGQALLMEGMPRDAGDAATAVWWVVTAIPASVAYVLVVLLAFVTYLAISREALEEIATFD